MGGAGGGGGGGGGGGVAHIRIVGRGGGSKCHSVAGPTISSQG